VTKEDFVEWKRNSVTQEIFSVWRKRAAELLDKLVNVSVYGDPRELAETAAAIKVYREILEMGEDLD
jgi:hypothetical protein